MAKQLGLVELIEALKAELRQLDKKPKSAHFFQVDGAEIEVNVVVKAKARGGVNFLVVQIGGSIEKEKIHKIKVKLSTLDKNDDDVFSTKEEFEKKYDVKISSGDHSRRIKAKAASRARGRRARARR